MNFAAPTRESMIAQYDELLARQHPELIDSPLARHFRDLLRREDPIAWEILIDEIFPSLQPPEPGRR